MSIEAIAGAAAGLPPVQTIQAGHGASLADMASFRGALDVAAGQLNAAAAGAPDALAPALKGMFETLEKVNGEARTVSDFARTAAAAGKDMTPGEIVQLTMQCQEFMFHCQLTSNIANRTSDGLQQLFRQQS